MKKVLINFLKHLWILKSILHYWIYGPYGVCKIIEKAPFPFIQPLLIRYGAQVGSNCVIDTGLTIHRPDERLPFKNLKIGDHVYLGHNTLIDLSSQVIIKNNTAFGAGCQIWTHTGNWTWNKEDEEESINPVIIGESVIVYSGVIISQGTIIENYARVGAGSVVLEDVRERMIVGGLPAKEIRRREFK